MRAGAALLALAAGCGSDGPPLDGPVLSVTAVGGDAQMAPAGAELAGPITVVVTDSAGMPVRGVAVRFRVAAGRDAQLTDSLAVTDVDGTASVRLRLGAAGDTVLVDATVRTQREPVARFRAVAGPAATLDAVGPATVTVGDTLELRGTGLGGSPRTVLLGAREARVVGASGDTLLRAVVPPCVPEGPLTVAVRLGAATTAARPVTVRAVAARPVTLEPLEGTAVAGTDVAQAGAAGGVGTTCLRLPPGRARWLLVPHFAGIGDSTPSVRNALLGVDTAGTPAPGATAQAGRALGPLPPVVGRARLTLEAALRSAERRAAERAPAPARGGQAGAGPGPEPEAAGAPPAAGPSRSRAAGGSELAAAPADPDPPPLGSERTFRVLSRLDAGAFATVTARLRHAGPNVLLYEDQASPAPLEEREAQRLGALFDGELYPFTAGIFGTESDVDGNGRVIVLLTPVVNALVPPARCAADGFVPGFFFSPDLDGRSPGSNRAEVFYAIVPDPAGTRGCAHDLAEIGRVLPPTFVHEFQHMISFNEHVLVRGGPAEDAWLNEGLSHMAEELLARRHDRGAPAAGRLLPDTAAAYLRTNLESASLFLANPSAASALVFQQFGTLPERGAAWLFLRWLGAQRGPGVYARLVRTARTSRRNVETVMGEPFPALFSDFVLALAADSLPGVPRARVPARFRFGAERPLRALLTRGLDRPTSAFPLVPRAAPAPGSPATVPLRPGGMEYFLLTGAPGAATTVRFAPPSGSFAPGLDARVGLLRLPDP